MKKWVLAIGLSAAALTACSQPEDIQSTDQSNGPTAEPTVVATAEVPVVESTPTPTAKGKTYQSMSQVWETDEGYTATVSATVYAPKNVPATEVPCTPFPGDETLETSWARYYQIDVTSEDTSPDGFAWPTTMGDGDVPKVVMSTNGGGLEWAHCADGGELNIENETEVPMGQSASVYFVAFASSTPKNPEGNFTELPPIEVTPGSYYPRTVVSKSCKAETIDGDASSCYFLLK